MGTTGLDLFYMTNRAHKGPDRFRPTAYSGKPSSDGIENLRFGRVRFGVDTKTLDTFLQRDLGPVGLGDGQGLAGWLAGRARAEADIVAYPEQLDPELPELAQTAVLGSKAMFADLKHDMDHGCDVVIYVHGFNTTWWAAVGGALSLQCALNRAPGARPTRVVLFTWPSDGLALPYTSYRSDRSDGQASGPALGRALLKFRDHLRELAGEVQRGNTRWCGREVHVVAHSMGNWVLQHAVARMAEHAGERMPTILGHVVLCAADVDDDVLEPGLGLGRLPELCRRVHVYTNQGDVALQVSVATKNNRTRLGAYGPSSLSRTPDKVHHIDASPLVGGVVEHGYFLDGTPVHDLALTLAGVDPDAPVRRRVPREARRWVLGARA